MQVVYVPVMPIAYAKLGIENTQIVLAVLFVIIALISFFIVKDTPEEAGTTPDKWKINDCIRDICKKAGISVYILGRCSIKSEKRQEDEDIYVGTE